MYYYIDDRLSVHCFNLQDDRKDKCSSCKQLKKENKRLRKTQRWLEVQLEELKRENHQLRQSNVLSQNLIQSSKQQLEVMEDTGRELKKLAPMLQRAATLIECSSIAQNGLSVNLSHAAEWFMHPLNNPLELEKHAREHHGQASVDHFRQASAISTQTVASSRRSSAVSSDGEEEMPVASEKLIKLSTDIVAAFPAVVSPERGIVVSDHQLPLGVGPASANSSANARNVAALRQQISIESCGTGMEDLAEIGDGRAAYFELIQGRSASPHINRRFRIK